ncbi:MAG: LapA family protein [Alphaproteobacteria bacterium]|nr:LapA family protein [Alphaproteobacteria bacterium]
MFSLLFYLIAGAVIVFFASANAHLVVVNLGLVMLQTPLFVIMGICFFSGFAVAVITALAKTSLGRRKRPAGKDFITKRANGKDIVPRIH